MAFLIAFAVVALVILGVSVIGDRIDAKTGLIVGTLIAGAVTTYLTVGFIQVAEDSYKPSYKPAPLPVCRQVGRC
jgi:hypothetical protein